MLLAYKYRAYPSGMQEMRLKRSLHALCQLYNILRAEKIRQHHLNHKNLTLTGLRAMALEIRRSNPKLIQVHSQAVQNVADRVYRAFQNYFEGRARFPHAKKQKDYRSLVYPQSGFKLEADGRLQLSKVGKLRVFQHRSLQGVIKRLVIKHDAREWYIILLTEQGTPEKRDIDAVPLDRIRGGDLGLERYLTLDNSESANYPEFLRKSEETLKQLQRHLSRKTHGSRRYRLLAFRLARLHLHVARQRMNWQNQLVAELYQQTDVLVLERLHVAAMLQNHCLAKSIQDASWSIFARKCIHTANRLGKLVVFVDSWGTSQFCYNCLTWVPKTLADREHLCPVCGVRLPRDVNSAKLVKWLGLSTALACSPPDRGLSPAEQKPLPIASLRGLVSRSRDAGSPRL